MIKICFNLRIYDLSGPGTAMIPMAARTKAIIVPRISGSPKLILNLK
jgi:hypothetical protein